MHCNAEKIGLKRKKVKLLLVGPPNILDFSFLNVIEGLVSSNYWGIQCSASLVLPKFTQKFVLTLLNNLKYVSISFVEVTLVQKQTENLLLKWVIWSGLKNAFTHTLCNKI